MKELKLNLEKVEYFYLPFKKSIPNRMRKAQMDTTLSKLDAAINKVFTPFTSP